MFVRSLLTLCLALVTLSIAETSWAWAPHPDCEFREKPVPRIRSCTGLDEKVLSLIQKRNNIQDAIDELEPYVEEGAYRQVRQGAEDLAGILNPIPTDVVGVGKCWLSYCREAIGDALLVMDTMIAVANQVITVSDSLQAIDALKMYRELLEKVQGDLDAAAKAADDCRLGQDKDREDRREAQEHNEAGLPLLDADDPKCKPPEELLDEPEPAEVDDPNAVVDEGGVGESGGAQGGGQPGSETNGRPNWDRADDFSRGEVNQSLDWLHSELGLCGGLAERDRRGCASGTLTQERRNKLNKRINAGVNDSGSVSERAQWLELRDKMEAVLSEYQTLRAR